MGGGEVNAASATPWGGARTWEAGPGSSRPPTALEIKRWIILKGIIIVSEWPACLPSKVKIQSFSIGIGGISVIVIVTLREDDF